MAVETEEQFRAWLEGQPQEVCVAIAYRAAMRVLPLATRTPAIAGRIQLTLALFRCSLTSAVAAVEPTSEVQAAARGAAAVSFAAAAPDAAAHAAAATATRAASAAADADSAAVRALATHGAAVTATRAASAAAADFADADLPLANLPRAAIPLPDALRAVITPVAEAADNALNLGGSWEFWGRWYARAMAGDALPWDLQKQVALIPDAVWMDGPEAVAAEIEKIEAAYLAGAVRERVEMSPTGHLMLVPQSFGEQQQLARLLDTVTDALDLSTADLANGLTENSYQVRLVRRSLSRYGNDPQRIEMDFERARVSLMQEIAEDGLPASPANRDLIQSLSDAAASIRDADPEIADARARLNRLRLGDIAPEAAEQIAVLAEEVAEISEGVLHDDLLEDRYRLPGVRRDDAVPDPVIPFGPAERNTALEARDAQVRLFARLARVWLYLKAFDRSELARVMDTPEAKLFGVISGLSSIVGLIVTLVIL